MENDIVTILVYLVSGVILFIAFLRMFGFLLPAVQDMGCTQSILSSVQGRGAVLKDYVPDFKCYAHNMTISRSMFKSAKTDPEVINATRKMLADEMAACWSMVRMGELDPYRMTVPDPNDQYRPMDLQAIDAKGQCLICSIVTFKDIPSFGGLAFWMALNPMKDSKKTYFRYLFGREANDSETSEYKELLDRIDTSKEYAVVWVVRPECDSVSFTRPSIPCPEKKWRPQKVVLWPYAELINTVDVTMKTGPITTHEEMQYPCNYVYN